MTERVLYVAHPGIVLEITFHRGSLRWIEFLQTLPEGEIVADATDPVAKEFIQYFAGSRTSFDIPFTMEGTPFQQRVWAETARVAYGETATYSEIARRIGSPNASRAVGSALRVNPLPIIIPCHRILGASGKLTGFAGGLGVKQILLDLEKRARD